VTHEPPSAMKGRLGAEAVFPGQPPPLPAVLGRTLFTAMGPLRLRLRVIASYACPDSIAAIVPGKGHPSQARRRQRAWRLLLEQLSMGKGSRGRGQRGPRGWKGQGRWRRSGLPPAWERFWVRMLLRNQPISTGLMLRLCGQHLDPCWETSNTRKLKTFLSNLLFP